jgi:hypothetical protein
MTPVVALFVSEMALKVVVLHPFVMGCEQISPCLCFFKAKVCHTSLYPKRLCWLLPSKGVC